MLMCGIKEGMKILVFDSQTDEDGIVSITETAQLFPDSAVILDRKPLFLPKWSEEFTTRAAVAARICRLGKHIALRFAHRYWNAASVSFITQSAADVHKGVLASIYDGSIALGNWFEVDCDTRQSLNVTVNNGDVKWQLPSHADALCGLLDRAIVTASQYATIKMGDLVAITLGESHPVSIGDILYGRIDEQLLLTTKIK